MRSTTRELLWAALVGVPLFLALCALLGLVNITWPGLISDPVGELIGGVLGLVAGVVGLLFGQWKEERRG